MKKLLFTALTIFYAAFAGKYRLDYNLKTDDHFKLKTIIDQEINQEVSGRKQTTKQYIMLAYEMKVVSQSPDNYRKLETTYTASAYKLNNGFQNIDYHSESSESVPAAASGFDALIGQDFVMEMNPKGAVRNVNGFDKIIEHMTAKMAAAIPGADQAALAAQLEQNYSDQSMTAEMNKMMNIYPDRQVSPGDSWKKQMDLNMGMSMRLETTYTLLAVTGTQAAIKVFSLIKANNQASPTQINGMSVKYNLSGKQQGKIKINLNTGLTQSSELIQQTSGSMKMMQNNMEIPITIKSRITLISH